MYHTRGRLSLRNERWTIAQGMVRGQDPLNSPYVSRKSWRGLDAARQAIHAKNHQARCEAVGGDFFQAVPPGGDLYVLKFILIDWKDAEAVQILQNCRTAIIPDGTLLVIEMTIPDDNHPSPAQLLDLNMLVMTGGQERTQSEYGALLAQAGFHLTRVIPTGSPFHVLEAVAV
jgi:hypothetical protein